MPRSELSYYYDENTGKRYDTAQQRDQAMYNDQVIKTRNQIGMDVAQGRTFGRELLPPGSLGRIGQDADLRSVIEARRGLAGGLTGAGMQAQREQATQQINLATEQARRRMQAAQARAGVRGATAGSQIGQILSQGLNQRRQFEQNLLANQFEAQRAGVSDLESSVRGVREFDLSQAARERFSELQTGLAFGQLGAIERGALAAAQATVNAARYSSSGGGGTSFLCTLLRKAGLMSPKESLYMLGFMFASLLRVPRFMFFYFKKMKKVIDSLELNIEEAKRLKQETVTKVIELDKKGNYNAAIDQYIKVSCDLATAYGIKVPKDIYSKSKLKGLYYIPKIFMLPNTWIWFYNFFSSGTWKKAGYRNKVLREQYGN